MVRVLNASVSPLFSGHSMYKQPEDKNITPVTPETVGTLMRHLRLMRNPELTYVHVAHKTNFAVNSLRTWETTGNVKFKALHKVLDFLGYEICIRKKPIGGPRQGQS